MANTPITVFTAIAAGVIGTVAAETIEFDTRHRWGALPLLVMMQRAHRQVNGGKEPAAGG